MAAARVRRARRDQQPRVRRPRAGRDRRRARCGALPPRSLASGGRLAGLRRRPASQDAVALVSALTLLVGGCAAALRHAARRSRASTAARRFGLLPMPSIGFHLVRLRDVRRGDRGRGRAGGIGRRDGPRAQRRARLGRRLRARRRRLLHRPLAPARPDRPLLRLVARAHAAAIARSAPILRRPGRGRSWRRCSCSRRSARWLCSLAQIAHAVVADRADTTTSSRTTCASTTADRRRDPGKDPPRRAGRRCS